MKNYKPNRKKAIAEVTFDRAGDEIWIELECGHYIRKRAKKEYKEGFDCDACATESSSGEQTH